MYYERGTLVVVALVIILLLAYGVYKGSVNARIAISLAVLPPLVLANLYVIDEVVSAIHNKSVEDLIASIWVLFSLIFVTTLTLLNLIPR